MIFCTILIKLCIVHVVICKTFCSCTESLHAFIANNLIKRWQLTQGQGSHSGHGLRNILTPNDRIALDYAMPRHSALSMHRYTSWPHHNFCTSPRPVTALQYYYRMPIPWTYIIFELGECSSLMLLTTEFPYKCDRHSWWCTRWDFIQMILL